MRLRTLDALLVVGLAANGGAHRPEGEVFLAVQFPDHAVPVIDGNLDDWGLVPEKYSIRSDKLFSPAKNIRDVERGEYDSSDIEVWHRIGYNPNTEEVYFASVVVDDYHSVDRENLDYLMFDDSWDVRVDPTGTWDDRGPAVAPPGSDHRTIYLFAVPPLAGTYHRVVPGEEKTWMLDKGGHVNFGWAYQGDMLGGECTYTYELRLDPIWTHAEVEEEVEWMDVEQGKVMHFNILIADVDGPGDDLNGFWTVSPGGSNNPLCDLYLAELENVWSSTSVEDICWGMIKAGLEASERVP